MPEALPSPLAHRVPRLVELLGAPTVEARWERPRAAYLWQIERDLELLTRRVGWPAVARAYRASLRNPTELWGVAYELRTAAKRAPVVDGLELRARVGAGACDLAVRLAGCRIRRQVCVHALPGVEPEGGLSPEDAERALREATAVLSDVRVRLGKGT